MITTNSSTNSLLTKAIDIKTNAVNQYRHDYIVKTSDLMHSKFNYSVVKASKQVQIIYDEIVKQLAIRKYSRDVFVEYDNIYFKFTFNTKIYNDIKFMVAGKRFVTWKVMQKLKNPLMKVKYFGSKKYGSSKISLTNDFRTIIARMATAPFVIDAIEDTTFAIDNIKINAQSLKRFVNTTDNDEHASIAKSFLQLNAVNSYLPMQYFVSAFGRKYYKGNKYINIQNAPSVIRRACFGDCVDIDINGCSNSYFRQQAIKYKIKYPKIKQYNRFKDAVRAEVAVFVFGEATKVNVKKAKKALTAISLGASIKVNDKVPKQYQPALIADGDFTIDELLKLGRMPFIKSYITEYELLHSLMLRNADSLKQLKIKEIHIGENINKPLKKSTTVNYLFQQFEANAMRTALKGFEPNIRLLVHDGVYLENLSSVDVNSIVNRFKKMDLTISVKQL